ncbi:hypothetical protein KC723_02810 [Candidatus Kaiserbacteria bacterium]|nr:hypothetical protein [Candidatus Kaiserbacteria bacterium]
MIRTKDFLLFLLTTGFLVLAITATVVKGGANEAGSNKLANTLSSNSEQEVVYSATVSETETIDRKSRIIAMRQKILELGDHYISAQESESEPNIIEDEPSEEIAESEQISTDVQLCDGYSKVSVNWPMTGIMTAEREGARIVYTEDIQVVTVPVGATTTEQREKITENILLQLPIRTSPLSITSCINHDVIGVALDGSLIRNGDYTAYTIFEKHTHIGYALDGFPIYGRADDVVLDTCGGAMVGTAYRYYLSSDREGMIACFSGVPVQI